MPEPIVTDKPKKLSGKRSCIALILFSRADGSLSFMVEDSPAYGTEGKFILKEKDRMDRIFHVDGMELEDLGSFSLHINRIFARRVKEFTHACGFEEDNA